MLSAIITRIRQPTDAVPLVAAYDKHENIRNPPMPLLFQSHFGTENRPVTGASSRRPSPRPAPRSPPRHPPR